MKMKYLLSSDNGYHWNTSIMFDSIEDAVIYWANEQIEEYSSDWVNVIVISIERPIKNIDSHIEVKIQAIDEDNYIYNKTVYISEITEIKPENKYNVTSL